MGTNLFSCASSRYSSLRSTEIETLRCYSGNNQSPHFPFATSSRIPPSYYHPELSAPFFDLLHSTLNTTMPLSKPADAPVLKLFSLAGKVVLVTGGARGIGLATVQGYAEAGASVALTYSSSKHAESTAQRIASDTGAKVRAYQCDVRDRDGVAKVVGAVRADFGQLDVVVANAGVVSHCDALEVAPQDFDYNMRTNARLPPWALSE